MKYIIILSTINELNKAKEISKHLLQKKLCACVNLIPKITSLYTWKNEFVEDNEILMLIKTKENLFEAVKNEINKLHPYETAEIISFEIKNGNKDYLNWIFENTINI